MRKLLSVLLSVLLIALPLCGCGEKQPGSDEQLDQIAGNVDEEQTDGALTVIVCGSATYDIEVAEALYEEKYETEVNLIKYDSDSDWEKFSTKVMAQDSDFDLFMPVPYQLGDVIRSRNYEDLTAYEDIKSRIESNSLVKSLAVMGEEMIGVPCNVQLSYSGDVDSALSLFKYCYKNIDLYTGEYSDPDGAELFELLKHRFADPSDSRENPFYDFEYYEAVTSYLFMNKNSVKKDEAADFLCLLFDILNGDVESSAFLTYPEPVEGAEYTPNWRFYSYDYVKAIGGALSSCETSDGSDGALKKLAEDAARAVRMRLEG